MKTLRLLIQKGQAVSAYLRPMHIPLHSAYTGFFLILSLFPSLLLLLGALKFTRFGVGDLMGLLEGLLPESLLVPAQALVEASYRHSSGTVVSVSALAALWSASRGMYGVRNGLNAVYGVEDLHSYWRKRGISAGYTFSFLLMLVLTLVLHVFGTAIVDYLWMTTNPVLMALMNVLDLRFLLLLVLQTGLFTILYALLPERRNSLLRSIPGAVAASLGWLTFSKLFSIYVEHFSNYTNIFGSIYALALGMLWLYSCLSIFFYGGALNRLLGMHRADSREISE